MPQLRCLDPRHTSQCSTATAACCRLQVCHVRATAAAEKPAEVSNYADEFTREIVDEEKK
jgi:hypothetical protein